MLMLEPITGRFPSSYSRTPFVIERNGQDEFVGFLHRHEDSEGVEGKDGAPLRLEDGEGCYFKIPPELRPLIPENSPLQQSEVLRV